MRFDIVAKALVTRVDGKILLLKRTNTDIRRPNQWDFPGGHVDNNEHVEDAVKREIKEETGLDAIVRSIAFAKTECVEWEDTVKHFSNATWVYFVCISHDKGEIVVSDEHSEATWATLQEALDMITYPRHREVLRHVLDNQLEI